MPTYVLKDGSTVHAPTGTWTSAAILDPDAVNRAVDDAGYELADAE